MRLTASRVGLWASRFGLAGVAALVATLLPTAPAAANSAAADYFRTRAARSAVPSLLSPDERQYYALLFEAIRRENWVGVEGLLARRPYGPLHGVALARFYLAPTSPRVDLPPILHLLEQVRELPWADQLHRLALKRGALATPELPRPTGLVSHRSAPKRSRPRPIEDGTMPAEVSAAIGERIKNDDPLGAYQLLAGVEPLLSPAALTEWRQRVAWSFYIENQDATALALARTVATGSGPWVGEGWWTNGLAAWRLGACEEAAHAFGRAAAHAANQELAAAGYYWASRAWLRCRAPDRVAANLRAAAQKAETFYGILAAEQLGLAPHRRTSPVDLSSDDWQQLRGIANVRTAVALAELGEEGLASDVLKHQARLGGAAEYARLCRLARALGLASTQLWLAYNAPRGAAPDEALRYPSPNWTPATGWKVDPALIYAHALQESNFRTDAVSPANARGLMQIMPATARQHGTALAIDPQALDLARPDVSLALGQRNLEVLRDSGVTRGLLPKVIAAYNAGLGPVARWNGEVRDGGDPLLWMESIPFWETRGYVSIVLRNYWMYERQAGGNSTSRSALAQGLWPKFPGLGGSGAVRLALHGD